MRCNRRPDSKIPDVNLVPMMDVLMTVLTFFIIISMSLTGQQILNVALPRFSASFSDPTTKPNQPRTHPFVVGLSQQGEVLLDGQPVSAAQLSQQVQRYLAQNPDGEIVLKADRKLTYDKIAKLLEQLGAMGGDRVSLAVEKN